MALSMALMLTACGGDDNTADGGDENDQTVTALTEEEYQQAVTDLSDKLTSIQTDAANLDPTDVDAAMKLLNDMKQPFIDFMAVTPPESYADAHAKMQSGCQARWTTSTPWPPWWMKQMPPRFRRAARR